MIQPKSRFRIERSSCTPVEKIALQIMQVVVRLKNNLDRGVETGCLVEINRLLELLNSQISSADATRVVAICADVPIQLEHLRYDMVAATVREMLDELKNWPPNETLGEEIRFGDLKPLDEFEVVETNKLAPGSFEVKGRFLHLERGSLGAIGLKGSSHSGEIVYFNGSFTIVRKVIKRQV